MYHSTGYQTIRQNAPDLIIYETGVSCPDVLKQHGHPQSVPQNKQLGPFLNNFIVERLGVRGGGGIVVVSESHVISLFYHNQKTYIYETIANCLGVFHSSAEAKFSLYTSFTSP